MLRRAVTRSLPNQGRQDHEQLRARVDRGPLEHHTRIRTCERIGTGTQRASRNAAGSTGGDSRADPVAACAGCASATHTDRRSRCCARGSSGRSTHTSAGNPSERGANGTRHSGAQEPAGPAAAPAPEGAAAPATEAPASTPELEEALANCFSSYHHIFNQQGEGVQRLADDITDRHEISVTDQVLQVVVKKALSTAFSSTIGAIGGPVAAAVQDSVVGALQTLVMPPLEMPSRQRFLQAQRTALASSWVTAERAFNHHRPLIQRRTTGLAEARQLDTGLTSIRDNAAGRQYLASLGEWTRLLHDENTPIGAGRESDPDAELASNYLDAVLQLSVLIPWPSAGVSIMSARLTGLPAAVRTRMRTELASRLISEFTGMIVVTGGVGARATQGLEAPAESQPLVQEGMWIARGRSGVVDASNIRQGHRFLSQRAFMMEHLATNNPSGDPQLAQSAANEIIRTAIGSRTIASLGNYSMT